MYNNDVQYTRNNNVEETQTNKAVREVKVKAAKKYIYIYIIINQLGVYQIQRVRHEDDFVHGIVC